MRRCRFVLPLASMLLAAGPGQAQSPPPYADATWQGRMFCDPLPPVSQAPLDVELTLTISGGTARYERTVLTARGQPTSYGEQGSGRVAPDGTLVLDGVATAPRFQYAARYEGRLGHNGRGALTGTQAWTGAGPTGQLTRSCRITLRRL